MIDSSGYHNDHYNNGHPYTIVPYEEILFEDGTICKKCPHPSAVGMMDECNEMRMKHDMWPTGFNFILFSHVDHDPDERVDFMETINIAHMINTEHPQYLYEACSDLKMRDGAFPRFNDKNEAFEHCINLVRKEFNVKPSDKKCIKRLYK